MGEIDTKPIEPVRNALSLFEDKGDHKKYQPIRSKRDCEKELEDLTKELANCKVQLEAKHAAHMQALLKLEHNQKMIQELSTLLKKSDVERNKHMNERAEGRTRKDEIESKMKEMVEQNLETAKVRDQLSHVLSELKATQRELLNKETELVAARDSELNALTNAEKLETALKIEKEQKEELLHQVKDMRKQIEMLQGLQNQPTSKSTRVDSHSLELRQDNEALILSEDSASNDIKDSNQLHTDMKLKERKIMDQSVHIEKFEMELTELTQELMSAKEEKKGLNITIESLTGELQKAKEELNKNKERDIEAQVEIALLKSQLQDHKLAYMSGYATGIQPKNTCQDIEVSQTEERNSENNNDNITISLEDYKHLVREAEKNAKEVQGSIAIAESELALMKKELDNAYVKIAELRARVEQALSRAELAEKAKAALEDKITRHRVQRQRRKAAQAALREESTPKPFSPSSSYGTPRTYQPLGKVLNMKL